MKVTDKYVNTLAECVSLESDTLKRVTPKYGKVATELAVLFAGENGENAAHVYLVAAQDSTANGDAWNRSITAVSKALAKLPDPLKFAAKRDFRPTHRDKAPFFRLVRIADAKAQAKENAEADKRQAEQAEAAAAADREAARLAQDAATTPEMIAMVAISEADRLGLDLGKVAKAIADEIKNRSQAKKAA